MMSPSGSNQKHVIGTCTMLRDVVSQIYRCSITSKESQLQALFLNRYLLSMLSKKQDIAH